MNAAVSSKLLLYGGAGRESRFTWFDRAGRPLGLVGDSGEYQTFRLSPDGRRLLAARARPGGRDLWLLDADRGVASLFTSTPGLRTIRSGLPTAARFCLPPAPHSTCFASRLPEVVTSSAFYSPQTFSVPVTGRETIVFCCTPSLAPARDTICGSCQ
jgi:hypothetical protein